VDLGITGRTAVVCASTSGLGAASARALGAEGANVVVSGRRMELAKSIAAELPSAVGVSVDLTAPGGPEELLRAAREAFGHVDILVLNGPGPRPATAATLDTESTAQALHDLLLVQQTLVNGVLPEMRERGWGRIVAIGSSGVVQPLPNLALSNIGRTALAAYLKSLSADVAADGVTVNMVLPGRIATDLGGGTTDDQRRFSVIPIPRTGTPADCEGIIVYLMSDASAYHTGDTITIDGGLSVALPGPPP
jgi:3-oxoacyl-[acyl-carrier protein] reductase